MKINKQQLNEMISNEIKRQLKETDPKIDKIKKLIKNDYQGYFETETEYEKWKDKLLTVQSMYSSTGDSKLEKQVEQIENKLDKIDNAQRINAESIINQLKSSNRKFINYDLFDALYQVFTQNKKDFIMLIDDIFNPDISDKDIMNDSRL